MQKIIEEMKTEITLLKQQVFHQDKNLFHNDEDFLDDIDEKRPSRNYKPREDSATR